MGFKLDIDVHGEYGFILRFPYDQGHVAMLKQEVLGVFWSKEDRGWFSYGPEIILDLLRFGYSVWPTEAARERADMFMQQVHRCLDIRDYDEGSEKFAYQIKGAQFLLAAKRAICADGMGMGKTRESLMALERLWPCKALILTQKSLIYNWEPEFRLWTDIEPVVMPDAKATRLAFWDDLRALGDEPMAVITNYEKVIYEGWDEDYPWDVLIIDEATAFKNYTSQRSEVIEHMTQGRRIPYVWFLSGTPLENRVDELYQLMRYIHISVVGAPTRFRQAHAETDMVGNVIGAKNLSLLSERIAPFLIRRTKADVQLQLPPKLYNAVWVELSSEERSIYDRMRDNFELWLREEGRDASEANKLTQLLRLQQFTSSPDLVRLEEEEDDLFLDTQGSKFQMLLDIIRDWDGRILVFSRFAEMTERLAEWLPRDVVHPEAYIAGSVKAQDRVDRVKRFNEGKLRKVFVSTDAGSHGLNIVGADLIIHYDLLWNPAKMQQREDRLHRIGQEAESVNVIHLMARDTIDAGMYYVLEERQALFDAVMNGAEEATQRAIDVRRAARGLPTRKVDERELAEAAV